MSRPIAVRHIRREDAKRSKWSSSVTDTLSQRDSSIEETVLGSPLSHQQLSPSPGSFLAPGGSLWVGGSIGARRSQLRSAVPKLCPWNWKQCYHQGNWLQMLILKPTPDPLNQKPGMEQTVAYLLQEVKHTLMLRMTGLSSSLTLPLL